jgi:hypothetical protein
MRIEGPRRLDQTSRLPGARGVAASGFSVETGAARQATSPSAAGAMTGLDALIAMQGVDDPVTARRKAVRRASDMLDALDDIKTGLLTGTVSRQTLQHLAGLVAEQRDAFNDPGLQGVIDEIDLRAQVELAKLEYAA